MQIDSLKIKKKLRVGDKEYTYYDLPLAASQLNFDLNKLPFSIRILFENLLRNENGVTVSLDDIKSIKGWLDNARSDKEIAFYPARVLMQDFTGVPAVVDLAAMRDAMKMLKGDPNKINPLTPVDLVIDHSVQVDNYGADDSENKNVELEMKRNMERYEFLRWGQEAFDNFRVVPPGTGICHQVNLEYLAQVVWSKNINGEEIIYPDTLVGTDSHTTMINGLAVLGWGVGGIEAEAAMLGQAISMLLPEVIGFKLVGKLKEGITATDLVLTVTEMLRKKGVVGKFVEFYGDGLKELSLADRATVANMAPEYGATCGFFPVDAETINYLKLSNRKPGLIELVESYAKKQNLWRDENTKDPVFTDSLTLDLSEVEPSLAGPKRPQDRIALKNVCDSFANFLPTLTKEDKEGHAKVVIAAITSCTNTSNPSVMIAAGLLARNAVKLGLKSKPWVKTSLAPGSQVVTEYLEQAGLFEPLGMLGFNLVGYGCTTCIGNSGPLKSEVEEEIAANNLVVASVLSGNRNFEGRIHPLVKANYLASPPLVVAYALLGNVCEDLSSVSLGKDSKGNDVYLKDIWPSNSEIRENVNKFVNAATFKKKYENIFEGNSHWQQIKVEKSQNYLWNKASTYINNPPYFTNMNQDKSASKDIKMARILAIFGDSITTDHISPAGNIAKTSPAAKYLASRNVDPRDFNSYGARRGNHEVMMRGTFANIRIKNELAQGTEGGFTLYNNEIMPIYDAAMKYMEQNIPLVIIAGKEYGTGSSRDWAAKGTNLLGVKAVIAESFERIHRSNLVGMGVLPLVFKDNMNRAHLNLKGDEQIDIIGIEGEIHPRMDLKCIIKSMDGTLREISLLCRIDTADEILYYQNGGILQYVLRNLK